MNIGSVLSLDFRDKAQRRQLQRFLKRLRPFASKEYPDEVPLKDLVGVVEKATRKYDVQTSYTIKPTHGGVIYIANAVTSKGNVGAVYGCCGYEVFAKLVALLCERISKNVIKQRVR